MADDEQSRSPVIHVSGEVGAPADDKITVFLQRAGKQVLLEIPSPGARSFRADQHRIRQEVLAALDDLRRSVESP